MKFKNKNVLVYGFSISGEWASKLLLKHKANVFLYDDNVEKLKTKNIKSCYLVQQLKPDLITQFDLIIVSPSIEYDNPYLQLARKSGVLIISELEFASKFCKSLLAITGTNGKTTTVQLITELLKTKQKTIACGNIGYPLSRAVIEKKRFLKVVEVSSFMLENCATFSPHVATILNIEPDHLIRHKTFEEYKNRKLEIFKNLKQKDYAVINLDNKICSTAESLIVTYSQKHIADVYLKDGYIYLHNEKIIALNELSLKGKHNIYNVMCAICYAYIYKIKTENIRKVLKNFNTEKFRIEKVARINNIDFVNDSKSTNVASTLASVDTIKGAIILLLGGSKKGLDYSKLFAKLSKRVKHVVAFGEIANELMLANNEKFKFQKCASLSDAFDFAISISKPNDTVLLSPASASYDQFENYIERGNAFNKKVQEYGKICKEK